MRERLAILSIWVIMRADKEGDFMWEVLSDEARVKTKDGRWIVGQAVKIKANSGERVIYIDAAGKELHFEPYSRSQFAPKRERKERKQNKEDVIQ